MSNQGKIHFNKVEVEYLMQKLGEDEPQKAVELFATIIKSEGIEPLRMVIYIRALMERDRGR